MIELDKLIQLHTLLELYKLIELNKFIEFNKFIELDELTELDILLKLNRLIPLYVLYLTLENEPEISFNLRGEIRVHIIMKKQRQGNDVLVCI